MNRVTFRIIKNLCKSLENVLPYAENEGNALDELSKNEPDIKNDADMAWKYLDKARKTLEFSKKVVELNNFHRKG